MNRRSLLQMLGLAALAPAVATLPATATPLWAISRHEDEPLYVVAFTRGPNGERYHHHMPATMHYHMPATMHYAPGGAPYREHLVIDCVSNFTGTVVTIDLQRGGHTLLTMSGSELPSRHVIRGSNIRLTITGS